MAETTKEPGKKPIDRVIRVFVSSTFADMHAEREELVKRVFPELRKAVRGARVTWGEVDLRWASRTSAKPRARCCPSAWPRSRTAARTSLGQTSRPRAMSFSRSS